MALKTLVKVGNISNLSDARYCAGMGVDMLGFVAIEGQAGYIPPKLYQDIRGWVAGPSAVLELYGLTKDHPFSKLLEDYRPGYIEVGVEELKFIPISIEQSIILSIKSVEDFQKIEPWRMKVHYFLIREDNEDLIKEASKLSSVILSLHSPAALNMLETFPIKGIALNGSAEVRPGFKSYDDLADVLEKLELD